MMARGGIDWLGVVIAAGCLAAGAALYAEFARRPFAPAAPLSAPSAATPASTPAWTMPPAETFAAVLARPLFTEGRRPPQKAAPVAAAVEQPALTLAVTAVILAPGRQLAVVETAPGKTKILSVGDVIDGWRLVEIAAEHLVFAEHLAPDGGARLQRLALKDLPGAAGNAPASIAATPARPAFAPDALATVVTIDGRQIEVLPEHQGERGEGSILAAMPAIESESNNP